MPALKTEKPIVSWDTLEVLDNEISYRMENFDFENDEHLYAHCSEETILFLKDNWNQKGFAKILEESKYKSDFEKSVRQRFQDDSDIYNLAWDDLNCFLDEEIEMENSDGYWRAEVSGFGWRRLNGFKYIEATKSVKLLREMLPDTECTFRIYKHSKDDGYDKTYYVINNFHHDSPTGENYYLYPISKIEFDCEMMIDQKELTYLKEQLDKYFIKADLEWDSNDDRWSFGEDDLQNLVNLVEKDSRYETVYMNELNDYVKKKYERLLFRNQFIFNEKR